MIDEATRAALFAEIHRAIAQAADSAVVAFRAAETPEVTYPPGSALSDEEALGLRELRLSPAAEAAVRKIVLDACSYPMFQLFCLLDGVADPESVTGHWPGLALVPRTTDAVPMYHDDFYESYWDSESGNI